MREFQVGPGEAIAEGQRLVVDCDGVEVGIFRIGGRLVAWHNQCPHRQGPVCQGRIYARVIEPVAADGTTRLLAYDADEQHLVCPWHGYEFDLAEGRCQGREMMRLRPAPLREEGGVVYVSV
ncbi:MAG: Rieske 2Fe-2S domain-containing protein [Rhodobacteraceae bacterium]|nr:Rieske 2Fe-2S domain-containing protein [Paracoccaceae bacterium]